jgi:hypothetical protein
VPTRKHLHIVVKFPPVGECESLVASIGSDSLMHCSCLLPFAPPGTHLRSLTAHDLQDELGELRRARIEKLP